MKRFPVAVFSRLRWVGEKSDRRAVAENDELTAVLRHLIAAPVNFGSEQSHARKPFHIPRLAPDQAACAHSWAEEQATQAVRDYGRACIAYSNRSMTDSSLTPWSGACYPTTTGNNG